MRIVCPICSAAYEVRDALLAPGRTVRCARCGEEWVPLSAAPPPPPPAAPEPAPPPEPEPLPPEQARREPLAEAPRPSAMERLASKPAPLPRPAIGLRVAWAVSLLVMLLLGGAMLVWRAEVMRAWPPSIRLYDALGLAAAQPAGRAG